MRGAFLVTLACVALAASACGGATFGGGLGDGGNDDGGSSSGSGSGSGSSGSGSGSGSSSGSGSGSGSSSGGSSSSSGGGGVCPPTPGEGSCSSGETCNYGSGCAATYCSCDSAGQWSCVSPDCPAPECPPSPSDDLSCPVLGQTCGYPTGGGCGEQCTCEVVGDGGSATYAWSCSYPPCPPPSCPLAPPQNGDSCMPVDESCDYVPDGGCGGVYCDCEAPGVWSCAIGDCVDASPPPVDAGSWTD